MRRVGSLAAAVLLLFAAPARYRAPSIGPVVAVEGDHFTVNGTPTFLIMVSYFDALRASSATWERDLAWLAAHGISGVRIFPNWWHWCATGDKHSADDAVVGVRGAVNIRRLGVLKSFLNVAATHGLIVDVSFSRETVSDPPMTVEEYGAAIAEVVKQIGSHQNVIVDVQNEWNNNRFGPAETGSVLQAVKRTVPARAAGASTTPDYSDAGGFARVHGADFAAPHGAGNLSTWYAAATIRAQLDGVRRGLSPLVKPIYVQESASFDKGPACHPKTPFDSDPAHAAIAVANEKRHGAAGWTFHTRVGFHLSGTSLRDALPGPERAAIEGLRAAADDVAQEGR
jgi:hypothetical protein